MLTPDVAPEFVTRRKRSIYTFKQRFLDTLPKQQSVRLTARRKRSVMDAVKAHKDMQKKIAESEAEHPKIVKRAVEQPKKIVKRVSGL